MLCVNKWANVDFRGQRPITLRAAVFDVQQGEYGLDISRRIEEMTAKYSLYSVKPSQFSALEFVPSGIATPGGRIKVSVACAVPGHRVLDMFALYLVKAQLGMSYGAKLSNIEIAVLVTSVESEEDVNALASFMERNGVSEMTFLGYVPEKIVTDRAAVLPPADSPENTVPELLTVTRTTTEQGSVVYLTVTSSFSPAHAYLLTRSGSETEREEYASVSS